MSWLTPEEYAAYLRLQDEINRKRMMSLLKVLSPENYHLGYDKVPGGVRLDCNTCLMRTGQGDHSYQLGFVTDLGEIFTLIGQHLADYHGDGL